MKKPVRFFSVLMIMILTIPVFKLLGEKFRKSELMRAYAVLTDRELFSGLV